MKIALQVVLLVFTVLFFLGGIADKRSETRQTYLLVGLGTACLIMLTQFLWI